jgi:hypothetical protein
LAWKSWGPLLAEIKGVITAQSPATARLNRVIGNSVVTTWNTCLAPAPGACWRGAPQAASSKVPARTVAPLSAHLIDKQADNLDVSGSLANGALPTLAVEWFSFYAAAR